MPLWPGRVSEQGEVATDGMGFVAVPDKARGHLSSAFNVPCPVMTGDKLGHFIPFYLLCATVAAPLTIKGGPRRTVRGFELLDPARFVASPRTPDKHKPAGVGYYA